MEKKSDMSHTYDSVIHHTNELNTDELNQAKHKPSAIWSGNE